MISVKPSFWILTWHLWEISIDQKLLPESIMRPTIELLQWAIFLHHKIFGPCATRRKYVDAHNEKIGTSCGKTHFYVGSLFQNMLIAILVTNSLPSFAHYA